MSVEVVLQDEAGASAPAETDLIRWITAAVAGRREQAEVTVRLVTEAESRELNLRYRERDYPTNVLSFEADLPPGVELPFLGDVVICPSVLAREAEEQGKPADAHWAHITVHGVLHLLGYDHEDDGDAAVMEGLEVQILAALGYPDPYAPTGAADRG